MVDYGAFDWGNAALAIRNYERMRGAGRLVHGGKAAAKLATPGGTTYLRPTRLSESSS